MRIGLIAPPWTAVPPVAYGGTEVVVDNLARGLTVAGHDVRLFTVGDSTCPQASGHYYDEPPTPMGQSVFEAAHVLAAYSDLDDVDLIHDHTVLGPLIGARSSARTRPIVSTYHGPFDRTARTVVAAIARAAHVVAISRSQARSARPCPISAVIHHGIDLEQYRPGPGDGGYLLFVGRMSPDKGVHRAVRIATATGMPLILATKMRERDEWEYDSERVKPLMGPGHELMIEPDRQTGIALMQRATALINPIRWPEPFGLVMAESLACATPVLSFGIGAAPEIIDHGVTGFVCADEPGLVEAVGRVDGLSRADCRRAAEERFSLERMTRDHLALYERLVTGADCGTDPITPVLAAAALRR